MAFDLPAAPAERIVERPYPNPRILDVPGVTALLHAAW